MLSASWRLSTRALSSAARAVSPTTASFVGAPPPPSFHPLAHLDTFPLLTTTHDDHRRTRPTLGFSPHGGETELSDQEWEMRTGRAIYILRQTYPHFFETGLVSSLPSSSSTFGGQHLASTPTGSTADGTSSNSMHHKGEEDSIYSPRVRLSYTPPLALPKPLQTLRIEGFPLYYASAVFVRRTLIALYSDLSVELKRITVNSSSSSSSSGPASDRGAVTPPSEHPDEEQQQQKRHRREKSVFIALTVTGTSRVSGGLGIWDVASTYTFSPRTALITQHTVDSIHPAPHESVYAALRGVLFRGERAAAAAGPAAGGVYLDEKLGAYSLGVGGRLERAPIPAVVGRRAADEQGGPPGGRGAPPWMDNDA